MNIQLRFFYRALLCLLAFFPAEDLRAQYVEIRGFTTRQQQTHIIPVYASLDTLPGGLQPDSIRVIFEYNPNRLRFDSVYGKSPRGTMLRCESPEIVRDTIIDTAYALLEIRCNSIDTRADSVLMELLFTTLAGRDTMAILSPVQLFVNGIDQNSVVFRPGLIRFPLDPPIAQRFPEGISQNYPNPFSQQTTFSYSITKQTNVSFSVFSLDGKEVYTENIENIGQGNYVLDLAPISFEWANGTYYIVMRTDEGVYQRNFLYLK